MSSGKVKPAEKADEGPQPFHLMGIEFAPLSIPVARRLQTLAVFIYINLFLFGAMTVFGLSFYFLFFTQYQWIPLLYWAWYVYDFDTGELGGRDWQ